MRMFLTKFMLLIMVPLMLLVSCGKKDQEKTQTKPEAPSSPQPPKESNAEPAIGLTKIEPTLESIQKNLLNVTCIGCHAIAKQQNRWVDLTNLEKNIVDHSTHAATDIARKTIVSGCPEESIFYLVLKENKMPPPPSEHIAPTDLKTIEQWIKSLGTVSTKCGQDEPQDTPSSPDEPTSPTDPSEPQ